jgi:hypothetical protein
MYNRLFALLYVLPTIRSALTCDILHPTILCALLWVLIQQPTIRSDLYGDSANDYLLCSTLSRDTTTDFLRCSTMSAVTTTDYPLCSTCRHYNRFSATLELCLFPLVFGSPISFSYMDRG